MGGIEQIEGGGIAAIGEVEGFGHYWTSLVLGRTVLDVRSYTLVTVVFSRCVRSIEYGLLGISTVVRLRIRSIMGVRRRSPG